MLGTVDIPGSQREVDHLGMGSDAGYFSFGVLLIDLKQCRETDALPEILSYIGTSQHNLAGAVIKLLKFVGVVCYLEYHTV